MHQPGIEELAATRPTTCSPPCRPPCARSSKRAIIAHLKAPDTEQLFLDLKKDVDYDAQIEKRAEALSTDALDRAYYGAIKQLMERTDESTYVIATDLAVPDRVARTRADRNGYLFGAPNDRPTAQPERGLYNLLSIQPFEPPRFRDEEQVG